MDDLFPSDINRRPGFRLHKLEVYNWGTFDSSTGSVHLVRPEGQTTLLVGQNESGKSTLVDALLTLLVRPVVRNYNVAAGGHKQDRDERSYIKGAYGRFSRDEDNRGEVRFLRPKGSHYSALLACFYNEDSNQLFTVAVVLYLTGDGRVEKVYCIAPSEKSIADDLGGLKSMDRLRQQIEKRGFRATTSYTEYHSWFVKMTGVRPKAMDIFNQTVAVKDIQSLNRFIREHMLESKPWGEKVASLLSHFTQLSEAHQSLVRVRRQAELLEPVAQAGVRVSGASLAVGPFATHGGRRGLVLSPEERGDSHPRQRSNPERLGSDRNEEGTTRPGDRRKTRGMPTPEERDRTGGRRTFAADSFAHPESPVACWTRRRASSHRYHEALRDAGIHEEVLDQPTFAAVQAKTPSLLRDISQQIAKHSEGRDTLVLECGGIKATLREDESELQALAQRQGNLPEWMAAMRRHLCADLELPEKDLPFAAEVISVKPEERAWESSIEMVLRSFALSLLVPQTILPYRQPPRGCEAGGRRQRPRPAARVPACRRTNGVVASASSAWPIALAQTGLPRGSYACFRGSRPSWKSVSIFSAAIRWTSSRQPMVWR